MSERTKKTYVFSLRQPAGRYGKSAGKSAGTVNPIKNHQTSLAAGD
ncbi:MAG: hypothetical protein ACLP51_03405 [Syntrophobacteraceae bacterium]